MRLSFYRQEVCSLILICQVWSRRSESDVESRQVRKIPVRHREVGGGDYPHRALGRVGSSWEVDGGQLASRSGSEKSATTRPRLLVVGLGQLTNATR